MPRPRTNCHWFLTSHREVVPKFKLQKLASEIGLKSISSVSAVLAGERPASQELAGAIARLCPGHSVESLFVVSENRPKFDTPPKPVTDWLNEISLLRTELAGVQDAAIQFVGTDGTFLRHLLAIDDRGDGLGLPTPFSLRRIEIAMLPSVRIRRLHTAGLKSRNSLETAMKWEHVLSRPRSRWRVDGGRLDFKVIWLDQVPPICATRVGNLVVYGHTGFREGGDGSITVPFARCVRSDVAAERTTFAEIETWVRRVLEPIH